jgi:hypothetical protein
MGIHCIEESTVQQPAAVLQTSLAVHRVCFRNYKTQELPIVILQLQLHTVQPVTLQVAC